MRIFHLAGSVAVAAMVFGCLQPARAALFSVSGIDDQPLPAAINDLIPTPSADFRALVPGGGVIGNPDDTRLFWSGGAQLSTTAANVTITYDYIGSFAEATNVFNAGSGTFMSSGIGEDGGGDSSPRPSFSVRQPSAGLVDFGFSTSLGGGASVGNISGNNAVGDRVISYLMSYLEPDGVDGDWKLTSEPTSMILILMDDAGRGIDGGDYDDLGVIAVATPVPASLPIFGTALAGLGLMVWRRKTKSQNNLRGR